LSARTPTVGFVLDVRDRGEYAAVADEVERRLGPVYLLFNNAGVKGRVPAAKLAYDMCDWVLGVNLLGVVNGIQTFVPRMIERGGDAYVVNTSSRSGLVVVSPDVTYNTAKFAVTGLSESLRHELAPYGIGVSVLCPGAVVTGIIGQLLRPAAGRRR
jgi:NAD(P)-dependent dehydrogenase (short-subunit alcohol dehydrogenase family)